MSEIKTRKYNKGNPKESNWPSEFGNAKKSTRYVFRDGKFTEINGEVANSKAPAVHQDTMDGVEHPAEPGKLIESKSQYRAITKKHGLEEIGNEKVGRIQPKYDRVSEQDYIDDVKKAINDCRWGNSGLSEYERHRCKEMDRRRNNHG